MVKPKVFKKDPDAKLDWTFDWSDWLADGETIVTTSMSVDGMTNESVDVDEVAGIVTIFVSGGEAGTTGSIRCRIDTSDGRRDDRTIRIRIRER